MKTIEVNTGRPYNIYIEHGIIKNAGKYHRHHRNIHTRNHIFPSVNCLEYDHYLHCKVSKSPK